MQQLAPTGQLVPVGNKLFYEAPTGDRLQVKDDRAVLLAEMLPHAYTGQLNPQQAALVKKLYDEVLPQASTSYQQLAGKVLDNQQQTINGLLDLAKTMAEAEVTYQPVVEVHRVQLGDAAEKIAVAGIMAIILSLVSLSVYALGNQTFARSSQPQTQYINGY